MDDKETPEARLGRRIAVLREVGRWSLRRLAEVARVSPEYLRRIESGVALNPSAAILDRIAVALGWPDFHTLRDSDSLEPPRHPFDWSPEVVDDLIARTTAEVLVRMVPSRSTAPPLHAPPAVPVLVVAQADAGSGAGNRDTGDYVYVHPDQARGRQLKAVRVKGYCLFPTLIPGDVVILDVTPGLQPKERDIIAATLRDQGSEGAYVFKRWGGTRNGRVVLRRDDGEPALEVPYADFQLEGVFYLLVRASLD